MRQGQSRQRGPARPLTQTEVEFFEELSKAPVEFMAQCSKDLNRCCYCNQPLSDPRSKDVGYGKTCACHWGLPWGTENYMETAPSFAKSYDNGAHPICCGVRDKPDDEVVWNIFGDWLEDKGLPRCKMPDRAVTMPRNDGETATRPATVKVSETPKPIPETVGVGVAEAPVPPAREVSTETMNYNAKGNLLTCEASDLQMYDRPQKLNIKSHKTGQVRPMNLDRIERDREGEVTALVYREVTGDPARMTLRIFND